MAPAIKKEKKEDVAVETEDQMEVDENTSEVEEQEEDEEENSDEEMDDEPDVVVSDDKLEIVRVYLLIFHPHVFILNYCCC